MARRRTKRKPKRRAKRPTWALFVSVIAIVVFISAAFTYATAYIDFPPISECWKHTSKATCNADSKCDWSTELVGICVDHQPCSADWCFGCDSADDCRAVDCFWTAQNECGKAIGSIGGTRSDGALFSMTYVNPGATVSLPFELYQNVMDVEGVGNLGMSFYTLNRVDSVQVKFKALSENPAVADPPGTVHSYFEITTTNIEDSDVDNVKITFKVPKTWVDQNNIDTATIKLYRYTTDWDVLSTTLLESDGELTFEASSPGFSDYAISGQEQACTGTVGLTLPSTAIKDMDVTAVVTGLSECSGKTVYIKEGTCDGTETCTITLTDGTGSCDFTAPDADDYTYVACLDMNNDADFDDTGESDSAQLSVISAALQCTETKPDVIAGNCIADKQEVTDWECDTTTGEWTELVTEQDCAVCGDGTCATLLGESTDTCPKDCGCPSGHELRDNTCVDLEAEAKSAIDLAQATITAASAENKDVEEAQDLLTEAVLSYNAADYKTSKAKADSAKLAAETAVERPIVEMPVLVMIISALVAIGGIGYYMKKRKAAPAAPAAPAPKAPKPK